MDLDVGKHCSRPDCHQLDFLPIKCTSCSLQFCDSHFKQEWHDCTVFDARRQPREVPVCPLCAQAVPLAAGEDANAKMDAHIAAGCVRPAPLSKTPPAYTSSCHVAQCKTGKSLVNVDCKSCGFTFCLRHRIEADHSCTGAATAANAAQRNNHQGPTRTTRIIQAIKSPRPRSRQKQQQQQQPGSKDQCIVF